jgi:SOUL heme-binding protein
MRSLMFALALFALPTVTQAIEEPDYAVVRKLGDVEVRYYADYVVAQVMVVGPDDFAGDQGIPLLEDYLFGKNKGEKTLAMTVPATQMAAPTRLEMTAPVMQSVVAGGYHVRFVLPKRFTLASAPEPIDSRVQLLTVPHGKIAAIIFSGFWSEMNYTEQLKKLTAALRSADLSWSGEPVYARYDAPGTPWFKRRNEIWLTLR